MAWILPIINAHDRQYMRIARKRLRDHMNPFDIPNERKVILYFCLYIFSI